MIHVSHNKSTLFDTSRVVWDSHLANPPNPPVIERWRQPTRRSPPSTARCRRLALAGQRAAHSRFDPGGRQAHFPSRLLPISSPLPAIPKSTLRKSGQMYSVSAGITGDFPLTSHLSGSVPEANRTAVRWLTDRILLSWSRSRPLFPNCIIHDISASYRKGEDCMGVDEFFRLR
jgi:hypothetical protein